ncbi:hypothetical protein COO60DRAFT_1514883 [Scenedesmus sp. NREL 46B-D3]|nr:hypothetical protein COO60DRAFT_1514883 [Scenedesmus sp. NREL 46B-D3]
MRWLGPMSLVQVAVGDCMMHWLHVVHIWYTYTCLHFSKADLSCMQLLLQLKPCFGQPAFPCCIAVGSHIILWSMLPPGVFNSPALDLAQAGS